MQAACSYHCEIMHGYHIIFTKLAALLEYLTVLLDYACLLYVVILKRVEAPLSPSLACNLS